MKVRELIKKPNRQQICIVLTVFIILYPLVNSFLGIDIGDTGIHYTNYKYLYSRPDMVGYSSVFTSIIGNLWLKLFGWLGLWGLNFLEVIIEWVMAYVTYRWLKDYYSKLSLLSGIAFASVACGCYLNVFNYHQFTVLLLLLLFYCIFQAIKLENYKYSLLAGIVFVLAVFARLSSVSAIIALAFYFYALWGKKIQNIKEVGKHILAWGLGSFVTLILFLLFMHLTGIWDGLITSIFKLKEMSSADTGSYSMGNLIEMLIGGTIDTLASPIILLGASAICGMAVWVFNTKKNIILRCFVPLILLYISFYLVNYSYDVNPVSNSPQFTTGPNFLCGVLLFIGIISFITKINDAEKSLLVLMSIFLPILTITGSSTGTKHVIISTWLLFPLCISFLRKHFLCKKNEYRMLYFVPKRVRRTVYKMTALFFIVASFIKYCDLIVKTNNFDSTNRLELTHVVKSKNTKFLLTTEREANALNGLIDFYSQNANDEKLVVFGSGLGLYALLDTEPYTRAWVADTSLTKEAFQECLNQDDENPIIVYCRTNQYFGYEEEDYYSLLYMVGVSTYYGKKDVLIEYMSENNYHFVYGNDYYYVFMVDESLENVTEGRFRQILYLDK